MPRPRTHPTVPGQVFGRLTVLGDAPGKNRRVFVRCSCPAATEKDVDFSALIRGVVKSCGCWNREAAATRARSRTLPPEQRKIKYVKKGPQFRTDDIGRVCSRCKLYKDWAEYNKGNGARGFGSWCKGCQQEHHQATPAERRRELALARRLKRFNLTVDQYGRLNRRFDGCCWRCKKPEIAKGPGGIVQRLSVDHDHGCCPADRSCGRCIRGLLCVSCNFVLGRIDGGQVDSYIAYLAAGSLDLDYLI